MKDRIKHLINKTDIAGLVDLMFENNNGMPKLRTGFYHERELWDFKSEIPGSGKEHELAWAEIARHVLAFHNNEGGVLIFGINDKDFSFIRAKNSYDANRFNNAIRKYIGDLFYVIFSREFIQDDQGYIGIALIPARSFRVVRFAADAPLSNNKKRIFSKGDIAVRENDSSHIYRGAEAEHYINNLSLPHVGTGFFINDENYRILAPEYKHFVYREQLCNSILHGLNHPRVAVTSLLGIGGVGKTALATWSVVEQYRESQFQ